MSDRSLADSRRVGKPAATSASMIVVDMPAVLRLDHDVEFGALDRGVVEQALVMHLDDIAAEPADDPGNPRQHARQIGQFGAQPHQTAAAHQAAHQQRGEQPRIDIAAGQHDADPPAAKPLGLGEQRRDPGRAGALDDQLLALDQQLDRALRAVAR